MILCGFQVAPGLSPKSSPANYPARPIAATKRFKQEAGGSREGSGVGVRCQIAHGHPIPPLPLLPPVQNKFARAYKHFNRW